LTTSTHAPVSIFARLEEGGGVSVAAADADSATLLDLRGGAHLLYEMDVNELRDNAIKNLRADVRKKLIDAKIGNIGVGVTEA
jgi:preprotein translocase subunit SecD